MINDIEVPKIKDKFGYYNKKLFTNKIINPIFIKLKELKIDKVEVAFDGGHDSGGVEKITYYKNNVEVDLKDADKRYPNLIDILSAPVYREYGSFAGEFSVEGTVVWENKEIKLFSNVTTNDDTEKTLFKLKEEEEFDEV